MMRSISKEIGCRADVRWLVRDKDRSVQLCNELGIEHEVLSRAGTGFGSNALEFAAVTLSAYRRLGSARRVVFTKYGALNFAARMRRIPNASFNDDDIDIVPLIAATSYPFADEIYAPRGTRMGKHAAKTHFYEGCHEFFYLHPKRFAPNREVVRRRFRGNLPRYGVVRLSALRAHHDFGEQGMRREFVRRLSDALGGSHRLLVSSEAETGGWGPGVEILRGTACDMHHMLAFAEFFVGDSQTMTAEAALLGTPAYRLSSFVGRLSYLERLEAAGLAAGFRPGEETELLDGLRACARDPDRKGAALARRDQFVAAVADPMPEVVNRLLRLAGAPCA